MSNVIVPPYLYHFISQTYYFASEDVNETIDISFSFTIQYIIIYYIIYYIYIIFQLCALFEGHHWVEMQ